ncbi:Hypothetical protein PFR_JS22-1_670 [Propionibacterium freudenreichii]|nr:Hypothetical protein PFR_JS22-1_670 [Propionibacterium freudenreichii]
MKAEPNTATGRQPACLIEEMLNSSPMLTKAKIRNQVRRLLATPMAAFETSAGTAPA